MPALLARGLTFALVTVVVLAAAPGAPGDVLVTADPRPPRAPGTVACIAGAGDVLVYERDGANRNRHPSTPSIVELDAASGQRLTLADQGSMLACPTVAAAADGTGVAGFLVVPGGSTSPRIALRPPGGDFGGQLSIAAPDAVAGTPAVAAAPGGWAAAAWVQVTGGRREVVAVVVAPDGTIRRAVLEASAATGRRLTAYSRPVVGVDAAGVATVAWTRWARAGQEVSHERVRVARSAPAATVWEPARELGRGSPGTDRAEADEHVALAVAPRGHALVAWSDSLSVNAVEGDAGGWRPAATLAMDLQPGLPAIAMTDDGAAVAAFSGFAPSVGGKWAIFAVHRAAGGAWSAAQRLSGTPARPSAGPPEGEPIPEVAPDNSVPLAATLASDGRELVVWPVSDSDGLRTRFVVATGRAGETWQPVRALSIPTRDTLGLPSTWIDPGGDPHVAWIEESQGSRSRLRADRLLRDADAAPPDITAPVLTVVLPTRLPMSRRRRIRALRLAVRCSEPCDLRGELVIPGEGLGPEATAQRALAAAGQAALSFRAFGVTALHNGRRPRHLRLSVTAADRAGNVTVRSRLVAVARR